MQNINIFRIFVCTDSGCDKIRVRTLEVDSGEDTGMCRSECVDLGLKEFHRTGLGLNTLQNTSFVVVPVFSNIFIIYILNYHVGKY